MPGFKDVIDAVTGAASDVAKKAIDSALDTVLGEAETRVTEVARGIGRARQRVRSKGEVIEMEPRRRARG
jgi:hypothetical protein